MDRPARVVRELAADALIARMDNRIGHALFIGADLPGVALHLLKKGLTITVVESDAARLDAFLDPLRAEKLDRSVSIDSRPYPSIEFLSSSYNVIVAWGGLPAEMDPSLFFKKTRRELKAGSTLYLKLNLEPVLAALPEGIAAALSLPEACRLEEVKETADRFLNFVEFVSLGVFTERLMLLPLAVRKLLKTVPLPTLEVARFLDRRVDSLAAGQALAASGLLVMAKTKEFGRVFRV